MIEQIASKAYDIFPFVFGGVLAIIVVAIFIGVIYRWATYPKKKHKSNKE